MPDLPEDAWISTAQLCALMNVHEATVRRRVRDDPRFPRPARLASNVYRWNEREARAYLRLCQQDPDGQAA
jgi:predicted DNA-binding transcriptional regulator AlpA